MSRKAEVLAWLSEWQLEAVREMEHATDTLVEGLGVSGTDPVIRSSAERCVRAHYAADTLGVVAACQAIRARARQLAGNRTKGAA